MRRRIDERGDTVDGKIAGAATDRPLRVEES
jgi:hypothetical protein